MGERAVENPISSTGSVVGRAGRWRRALGCLQGLQRLSGTACGSRESGLALPCGRQHPDWPVFHSAPISQSVSEERAQVCHPQQLHTHHAHRNRVLSRLVALLPLETSVPRAVPFCQPVPLSPAREMQSRACGLSTGCWLKLASPADALGD